MLRQLVELIPSYLVPKLARQHGVDGQARTFTPWSHVVTLLYAQLTHALSLNDVCDGLRLWATPLRALRGATPPSRNALSHANKIRSSAMAEALFWQVLGHLQNSFPGFRQGAVRGLAWRFRRSIHVVDATVIQLVTACLDWAQHKRRKAAAKVHLRLSLRSLLPGFVVIGAAKESEIAHVRRVCAGLQSGEIVLFDKGYQLFAHFWELSHSAASSSSPAPRPSCASRWCAAGPGDPIRGSSPTRKWSRPVAGCPATTRAGCAACAPWSNSTASPANWSS